MSLFRLGTCNRCIRLACLLMLAAFIISFVALPALGATDSLITISATIFVLLFLLWFSHVLAFAWRSTNELRQLRRARGSRLAIRDGIRNFLRAAFRAMVVPISSAFMDGCNCYFDDECFLWRVCDYSARCFRVRKGTHEVQLAVVLDCPASERASTGSCDGRCAHWRSLALAPPETIADGIEAYLDLFIEAAATIGGEGSPAPEALNRVKEQFPREVGEELRSAVYSVLDVLLGWDLVMTNPSTSHLFVGYRDAFLGHIAHAEATPALLLAARTGLGDALRNRDPDQVAPPLAEFWGRYPDYRPEHMGRCYPHGGHRYYDQAIDCHVAHLRRTVAAILQV